METGDFQKSLEKRFSSQVQGDSKDRTFLPIEAFDPLLDIEVPQDVIKQYEDPATGQTIGLSKWNFPSGEAELRECMPLGTASCAGGVVTAVRRDAATTKMYPHACMRVQAA